MGTATREDGVLKLIFPGKRIESYTKPIPAAEILRKYPKFCITRPDVFKFPWIVVKPDSVLVPGKVFLLVPKRTVYRLLTEASRRQQDLSSSSLPPLLRHDQSSETRIRHPGQTSSSSSPMKSSAGMTPKYQNHHRKRPKRTYQNREKPPEQDLRRPRSRKYSQIESWPQLIICNNKSMRYSHVHDCYTCGTVASVDLTSRKVAGNGGGKRETTLKSCMRKPGSAPRLVNPRVTFAIPDQDIVEPVPKQRTVIESLSKLAALLTVDACR